MTLRIFRRYYQGAVKHSLNATILWPVYDTCQKANQMAATETEMEPVHNDLFNYFAPTESAWVDHTLNYSDSPGSGWSFPCDEEGNVIENALHPSAVINLAICRSGVNERGVKILLLGVAKQSHFCREPGQGECSCGHEVYLDSFTCTCEGCGADYSQSGNLLSPRAFWGEETGETLSDILTIN